MSGAVGQITALYRKLSAIEVNASSVTAGLDALWSRLKSHRADDEMTDDAQGELFVLVSADSWRTVLVKNGQNVSGMSGEAINPTDTLADNLRVAIRSVSARQREEIGKVTLLVSDPAIELLDNRFARLRTMDPTTVRQFGAQQLGCESATFSFIPFGKSSERETPRGVYAFLNTAGAREYLGALDTLAVKLTRIVPTAALLVGAAEEQAFAALEVRRNSSSLLLADPETGALTSREIPIGVHSFAQAVAEAMSVSPREALEGFQRRDCFSALGNPDGGSRGLTATGRALAPVLETLASSIKESIDYFTFHRIGSPPTRLVLSLEGEKLSGFPVWLERACELPVLMQGDLLESYSAAPATNGINLLEGAPDGLLRIGKIDYRYVNGRFRASQPVAKKRTTPLTASSVLNAKLDLSALQGLVTRENLLRFTPPGAALLIFCGILGFTFQQGNAELTQQGQALANALAQDGTMRTTLAKRENAEAAADGHAAFLWTDKLTTIARSMPPEIVLTNLAVVKDANTTQNAQRIVVEGQLPADSPDHMRPVTNFVEQLMANANFMRDFRTVTFDSETGPRAGEDGMSKFVISIWFDPAKRRDRGAAGATP